MFSSKKKSEVITAVEEKKITIAEAKKYPKQWQHGTDGPTQLITDFSKYTDATSLAHTCRFLYHGTKQALDVRKLKELARYVVLEPNEDKVTAMLTLDPTLIHVVFKEIIDNSGRILLNNTIFQLAYGASDPEMCLAIKPFFVKVYGGEEAAIQAMQGQLTEKFAENKEEDAKEDKKASIHFAALLKPVIAAITNEAFNSGKDADNKLILSADTLAAIETFRKEFTESQPKRILQGMHFSNNRLLEMYNAYVPAAIGWGYHYHRCALFEDGFLSYVLRHAPANDGQRYSQGLYYLQDRGMKFIRSLTLGGGKKSNFYLALRDASDDFSLTGSCVNIFVALNGRAGGASGVAWNATGRWRRLEILCRTKTSSLRNLCDLSSHSHARRLAV